MIRNVTKLKFDWNKTKVSVSKIPLTMVQAVVSDAVMALGDLWAAEARTWLCPGVEPQPGASWKPGRGPEHAGCFQMEVISIIPRWLMISYAFLYYIYSIVHFCHTIPNFLRGLSDSHDPLLWESTENGDSSSIMNHYNHDISIATIGDEPTRSSRMLAESPMCFFWCGTTGNPWEDGTATTIAPKGA